MTWFYVFLQLQPDGSKSVRRRQRAGLIQGLGFLKGPWQRERENELWVLWKVYMLGLQVKLDKGDGAAMRRQSEWKGQRLRGLRILVGWDRFLSWGP